MAEPSAVAFGRYLRQLRERRGFSLARVCELSRSSSEPFDKGTLSRLERGQQTPSIFRLGPLARIYEISADALLERMELDRELDRIGGPETADKSYAELHRAGGASAVKGHRYWDAYAFYRDALPIAGAEKKLATWINLASTIRALGKNALAFHELRELEATGPLDSGQRAMVHERMSNCCRCLSDMQRAEEYADSAIAEAEALGDVRMLAYAYCTRGDAAIDQEQWTVAYGFLMKSLAAYRDGTERVSPLLPSRAFEAQALLMLAECSLQMRNMPRARRLTLAAKRISQEHDVPLGLAYAELNLGWIDEAAGRVDQALVRWRKAADLAARIDSPRIVFTAEVEIFRQALEAGEAARARAAKRRLDRLVPWIPRHIPAYRRFKLLVGRERPPAPRAAQGETHDSLPNTSTLGARGDGDARVSARRRRPAGGPDAPPGARIVTSDR